MSFPESNLPDLTRHANLLTTLTNTNKGDKVEGEKLPDGKIKWSIRDRGLFQGPTRTALNALESAKEQAASLVKKTINWATSTPSKEDSTQQESSLLADAKSNIKYIKKEISELTIELESIRTSLPTMSSSQKKVQLAKLEYLDLMIRSGLTGVKNLKSTYEEEQKGYKTMVFKMVGSDVSEKYEAAVEGLTQAEEELSSDRALISKMKSAIREDLKLQKDEALPRSKTIEAAFNQGLATEAPSSSMSTSSNIASLPQNFPKNVKDDKNNVLVAVNNILSDPFLGSILRDERELSCNSDGALALRSSNSNGTGKDDIRNFTQSLSVTYGKTAAQLLTDHFKLEDKNNLTWKDVKSIIAFIPHMAGPELSQHYRGNEKILSFYPHPEELSLVDVENAISSFPDGKGRLRPIKDVFRAEYEAVKPRTREEYPKVPEAQGIPQRASYKIPQPPTETLSNVNAPPLPPRNPAEKDYESRPLPPTPPPYEEETASIITPPPLPPRDSVLTEHASKPIPKPPLAKKTSPPPLPPRNEVLEKPASKPMPLPPPRKESSVVTPPPLPTKNPDKKPDIRAQTPPPPMPESKGKEEVVVTEKAPPPPPPLPEARVKERSAPPIPPKAPAEMPQKPENAPDLTGVHDSIKKGVKLRHVSEEEVNAVRKARQAENNELGNALGKKFKNVQGNDDEDNEGVSDDEVDVAVQPSQASQKTTKPAPKAPPLPSEPTQTDTRANISKPDLSKAQQDSRNNMLDDIRKGATLKKAKPQAPKQPLETQRSQADALQDRIKAHQDKVAAQEAADKAAKAAEQAKNGTQQNEPETTESDDEWA